MNTLTIKLKQHTPLIHFQHDQEGATLRASEVKPKLDRFILSKLSLEEKEKGKKEGWIRSKNDKVWLDYKMRILAQDVNIEYMLASYINPDRIKALNHQGIKVVSNTPFFAQEKQNNQILKSEKPREDWNKIEKKGILAQNDITIIIISPKVSLLSTVSRLIQSFFIVTNFGTRQSKGFGCFSPKRITLDGRLIALENVETLLKQHFSFVYKKSLSHSPIESILSTINEDYRLLKSGCTRPYAKSKLMLYAENLDSNVGWDKKYIKVNTNDVFPNKDGDNYLLKCRKENIRVSYSEKDSYRYLRALLGLAEQYEFLLENPPLGDSRNKMIVKVLNNDIQRYQSPLLFKVIENTIYLVGNEVSPDMLDKPFHFYVNFQNDSGYSNEPVDENDNPIYTPSFFSLRNFLSFAMHDNTNGQSLGYITFKG